MALIPNMRGQRVFVEQADESYCTPHTLEKCDGSGGKKLNIML